MKKRNRQFLSFIDHVYDTSLCAARDPISRTAHLTYLKASCHRAREISLDRSVKRSVKHIRDVTGVIVPRGYQMTPDQLYQLSCIARSLPAGGDVEEQKALYQFQETCLGPRIQLSWTTHHLQNLILQPERVQKALYKCMKRCRKVPSARLSPVGESSCAIYTAKEGGRTRHFNEVTESIRDKYLRKLSNFKAHPAQDQFISKFMDGQDLTVEDGEFLRHKRRCDTYDRKESARPRIASRTVVVRELGNKVRIVTINDPYLVTKAHSVRKVLFPLVTKWRGCREALGELPKQLRLNPKSKPSKRIVISGDLSRATDTLLHSWLTRLCLELDIDPTLIHLEMKVGSVPVTRGAFMGLPASWTLLELTHWIICINVDPFGNFFLKGDDILAWWTKKQWKRYQLLCGAVGFLVNTEKSYISRSRGTFCEGLYRLSQDSQGPLFELMPTLPLRGFVKRDGGPFFPNLATTMDSAVRRGYPRLRLWNVASTSYSKEFEIAAKFRVNFYLPECLGGLGLPHPSPEELSGQFVSSLVWGGLNQDLSAPAYKAVGARTRCCKIVTKRLSEVKYRSGLREEETCSHLENWSSFYRMRASVLDLSSKVERTEIGMRKYLGMLRKAGKSIPRAPIRTQDRLKWGTIPTLFKELKPTRASVQSVYSHPCDIAGDSRLCEA